MSATYVVEKVSEAAGVVLLRIGFTAVPAATTVIVPDAVAAIRALNLAGGELVKFNGPAALPVAMALAHAVAHLFGAVACFDPKVGGYVVCITHDPNYQLGQLLS
jgi:CRISPR-associated protein Csx3